MENKVGGNDDHDLRPAHQLNGGQVRGLERRLDNRSSVAAAAAANSSGRKRRSNKGGGYNDLKVVYISTPMKVRTSASKFREIVQELTGKYSDVARIMESCNTTGDGSELKDLYWTTLGNDVADDHSYQHHHEQKKTSNANYYDCNNINNNTQIQNKDENLQHVVRGGTAPPLPLGEHSPASSSATPTSGSAESLMFDYQEPFDLDDLQVVCTAGGRSGARLDDDHLLMADEGSLLGSFNYLEFPGDGGSLL